MTRILLIDDDEIMRTFMREILESAGYGVDDVPNGKSGMDYYQRYSYALVVTDMFMPEKDGLEVILELREQSPDIPVIAVSEGGNYVYRTGKVNFNYLLSAAKELGADEVFEKPFNVSRFLGTVQKLISVHGEKS